MIKDFHRMRPPGSAYERGLVEFGRLLQPHFVMVEVGCFAGESTAIFAPRVKTLYAVDPWLPGYDDTDIGSKLVGKDIEDIFDEMVKSCSSVVKLKMTSEEASRGFEDESIDAVYIDACHQYGAVRCDNEIWLPKVRTGGIISGHDFCIAHTRLAVLDVFGGVDGTFVDDSWFVRKR